MENANNYFSQAIDWAITFAPKLLLAITVWIIGFWIVKRVVRLTEKSLETANVGPEIGSFLKSLLDIGMKFVVILFAASMIGFEMTSLVAVMAAAGFAIALALQGFLGNFASGITIVLFKPYKVGDYVEVAEKFGVVESIEIFSTVIITPGQKTLLIPNGKVTDGVIINYSTKGHIRLELEVTMPYAEDFPKVKPMIINALKEIPELLQEPEPEVGIIRYDSHSIVLAVRPFIEPANYWGATFDAYGAIKKAFNANGVQVAYSEGVELGSIGE